MYTSYHTSCAFIAALGLSSKEQSTIPVPSYILPFVDFSMSNDFSDCVVTTFLKRDYVLKFVKYDFLIRTRSFVSIKYQPFLSVFFMFPGVYLL